MHRVSKISDNGVVAIVAGNEKGCLDGIGIYAKFNQPLGFAIHGSGSIAVADSSNNRIRIIIGA